VQGRAGEPVCRAGGEALTREISSAAGLGGRGRRAASHAERARVNVVRTLRAALTRISDGHPVLGRQLATTVHTGFFCVYQPDPRLPICWGV
jgi:hypothetical protein